jgi:uncharacterized protein
MYESSLITIVFTLAFFFESIMGFGGLLIALSILSFFLEIKALTPVIIYVGFTASMVVLFTDRKTINWSLLIKTIFPISIIGLLIGVNLFSNISEAILLKVFAIFLVVVTLKSLIFLKLKLKLKSYFRFPLLFAGGIAHGLFSIGGPFTLLAVKESFINKNSLRSTMAFYFAFFNLVRFLQLNYLKKYEFAEFFLMWWLIIPISLAVLLGYRIHLRIPEDIFKKIINILLLAAGLIYITK